MFIRLFSFTVFIFLLLAATHTGGGSSPLWGVPGPVLVYQRPMDAMVDATNDLGVAVLQVCCLQFIATYIILTSLHFSSYAVDFSCTCVGGYCTRSVCSFLLCFFDSWFDKRSLLGCIAVHFPENQSKFRMKLCLLLASCW
jgi:hypothetical protein